MLRRDKILALRQAGGAGWWELPGGELVGCFAFASHSAHGEVTLSTEHSAYQWLTIDEYRERYCNAPASAPAWAESFLREMRANCDHTARWATGR